MSYSIYKGDYFCIPGTRRKNGVEIWYFEGLASENKSKQYSKLLNCTDFDNVKTGSARLGNCELITPDSVCYIAISIKGDLDSWRTKIHEGARGLGLSLGQVFDEAFVVKGKSPVMLSDCNIRFFRSERTKREKPKYRDDFIVKGGVVYKMDV